MAIIREDNGDARASAGTQYALFVGDILHGSLNPVNDKDWFRVELSAGTATGGHAGGDVFAGVESTIGSIFGDTLVGGDGNDRLDGDRGNLDASDFIF